MCRTAETALAVTLAERQRRRPPGSGEDAVGTGEDDVAGAEDGFAGAGVTGAGSVAGRAAGSSGAAHAAGNRVAGSERLRLAAAVAGAAVRVAVETWAATDSPPTGPDGPAALTLALRNLEALRGFGWGEDEAAQSYALHAP